ncbi:MAG: hypothetical protein LBV04_10320 [Deferribacteraceae bacterium]|jgi:hypothetical protein|nr:hypothetical protein [Deferribacteraceae bacterium]
MSVEIKKLITAKKIVKKYSLNKLMMIDLVNNKGLTIYDLSGDIVSLDKHRSDLSSLIENYSPIGLTETLDEIWEGYTKAFDFGIMADTAKESQMKYEIDERHKAFIQIEYDLIVKNYYFEESEFEKVYSDTKYETIGGKLVVHIAPEIYFGRAPEMIYEIMNRKYPAPIIAKVIVDKKDKSFTKTKAGELFYDKNKDGETSKDNSTFVDKINTLIKLCEEQYIIKYD